ncbi:MAG TPA: transcriptional regulator, partial [Ruminiclostridium sp.]
MELTFDNKKVVILEIERAAEKPVQFKGSEYIRVGSYNKNLKDFPETERELWRIFDNKPFESMIAMEHLIDTEVLNLLDYPKYFELLKIPLPEGRINILNRLKEDDMLQVNSAGGWNITNLGAILFAKKLS